MSKISVGKVITNALLLSAFGAAMVTGCGMICNEKDNSATMVEVTVPEYDFDAPRHVEYAVPLGNTSFKSYMDWGCITNTGSDQYKLQQKCVTDDNGLRRFGDDYVIALGSYYSTHIGDKFLITLSNGESFTAVVGDLKADRHTDSMHRYTPMSDGGKNIVEFIVDTDELDSKARRMGDISYINGFSGNVEKVEKLYDIE